MTALQKEYKLSNKLGSGTYGTVYQATSRKDPSHVVAVKRIKLYDEEAGFPVTTIREVALLKELKHRNVVDLERVFYEPRAQSLSLVFEFLDNDLFQHMTQLKKSKKKMHPLLIKSYMSQLLKGLVHCHVNRCIHRDLKPQNLLINSKGILKIADFGLARIFSVPMRPYTTHVITLWYRAPELLLGSQFYGCGVDVWSVGCIFAEMLTMRALLTGDSAIDQLQRTFRMFGTPTEQTWPGVTSLKDYKSNFPQWFPRPLTEIEAFKGVDDPLALDLISKMLTMDPSRRISAKDALKHPYFADLKQKLRSRKARRN